jgi:hypothetical protein
MRKFCPNKLINMKKSIILFVILIIINITTTQAQQLRPNSINKASHNSYRVDSVTYGMMEVNNLTNTLRHRIPKTHPQNLSFKKDDNLSLINSFKQAFTNARLVQLENEPAILLLFKLSPTGKLIEVTFSVKENTSISISELEALENAIKKNVTFKLNSGEIKGADFFEIGQNVLFKRVVDGTLDKNGPG